MSWSETLKALAAPFREVSFRIGSRTHDKARGMVLTYIDARDVMDRLDGVLGPGNWSTEFKEVAGRVVCRLTIRPPDEVEWVSKEDGAGETDMEGEKGALSDAFKRAAVHFGVGRYLYQEPQVWVELEAEGKRISKAGMAQARREYAHRHGFGPPEFGDPSDGGGYEEPPPPQEERRPDPPPQQRDVKAELEDAQAVIAERKKLMSKQFGLAEKLWGKPIPQERRFQIMDWVLKKMSLRVQKQIDTVEKCREAMRWVDQFEIDVDPSRPGPF